MPGVARLDANMIISGLLGNIEFPGGGVRAAETVTNWFGPVTIQVATGVTEQAVIVLGTQGLTTITDVLITSDVTISVTYGVAANNVPMQLAANKFHAICGTSITALSLTNASGSTANVTYLVAGA